MYRLNGLVITAALDSRSDTSELHDELPWLLIVIFLFTSPFHFLAGASELGAARHSHAGFSVRTMSGTSSM
jgi:hypothetical protein